MAIRGYSLRTVTDKYNGKRGALIHYKNMLIYWIGGYKKYQSIDFASVKRLIFICKGNICRSAYAEAKFRQYDSAVNIASFGLEAVSKRPAYHQAIDSANQRGVNLSNHRTRSAKEIHVTTQDLLIVMEPNQAIILETLCHETGAQITLLGLWADEVRPTIADPYGRGSEIFESCFDYIDTCTKGLYMKWRQSQAVDDH